MYNRYLAPSNCENYRHGSVSGCRNRIFSVIDNCSASGQLLIDSFHSAFSSCLYCSSVTERRKNVRRERSRKHANYVALKKKAFCKHFNDFLESNNIKINVSRILSKDIRKDIDM